MTAYNVVRFKVKPGQEQAFVDFHKGGISEPFKGFKGGALVKTGDRTYCFVGAWDKFDSIVGARPQMIALLDNTRNLLEDQGNGLGVTDAASGEAVVEFPATK